MVATILVIEDEPDVARLLQFHLTRAGYQVILAAVGYVALDMIATVRPDLIVLDLMLPDIDGFGICEIIRHRPQIATIPIIIHSAWATQEARDLARELGALDYVIKPTSPKKLVERIQQFFGVRVEPVSR